MGVRNASIQDSSPQRGSPWLCMGRGLLAGAHWRQVKEGALRGARRNKLNHCYLDAYGVCLAWVLGGDPEPPNRAHARQAPTHLT